VAAYVSVAKRYFLAYFWLNVNCFLVTFPTHLGDEKYTDFMCLVQSTLFLHINCE
jgi:hypothetical protein